MNRQELYDTIIINPGTADEVKHKVERMKQNAYRYSYITKQLNLVPKLWAVIAVIHDLECGQDFSKYLGNGESIYKVTVLVPKGRGPFNSFEDGAVDALKLQGIENVVDWTVDGILYWLEGFNGYGYEKYHNMPSPYLWAGTNHYTKGKYVETKGEDGQYHTKFYPEVVSKQIGVAVLLNQLWT